ncbi:globin-like protein [Phyllosticta capitalensis]|uniref:globin-like protein n=1 Tax=Phyllosticta capitalensis TaxID=121624 RepID=UPI00312EF8E4
MAPKHQPLTPAQVAIIKSTAPVLAEHGNAITTVFYKNMLDAHKELNHIFNTANQLNGHQPKALATALYAYASYIDNLGVLSPAVELIVHKHASLYIRPEHYEIVGKYLLEALAQALGAALTPDIHDAWAAAYWQLADLLIGKEAALYASADGWTDWRRFRIARKVPESSEITSFYLEPTDASKPLPSFLPGQYISVRTSVPSLPHLQPRQYSLSSAPGKPYYRISVKREDGAPDAGHPGFVSNVLHGNKHEGDEVEVSHPFGDFYFDAQKEKQDAPVVLVSAGVGLTCLLSILETIVDDQQKRPVTWIHGARSTGARAFAAHIRDLATRRPNLRTALFTSRVQAGDVRGVDFDHEGRVDLALLDAEALHLANPDALYYVCGPEQFMLQTKKALLAKGVDESRVRIELFGTGGVGAQ